MNARDLARRAFTDAFFNKGQIAPPSTIALAIIEELERRVNAGELGMDRGLLFEMAIAEMRKELE